MNQNAFQKTYRKRGWAIAPARLSDAELALLRGVADRLLEEKPEDGGGDLHRIGRGESRRFLRHRHKEFPAYEGFLLEGPTATLARDVLGADARLFNEQFVVKGAGAGASFAWHQDGAYVGFEHRTYLTIWVALDDATIENGCVYLLDRDLDRSEALEAHHWDEAGAELVGYDGPDPGVAVTCAAGSIVAFSSATLHRSGANVTQRRRRALVAQYSAGPLIDPETGAPKRFATALSPAA